MAKLAGSINAEKRRMRQQDDIAGWIGEHKGLTFFIVSAIVSFAVLILGVEIDPGSISNIGNALG